MTGNSRQHIVIKHARGALHGAQPGQFGPALSDMARVRHRRLVSGQARWCELLREMRFDGVIAGLEGTPGRRGGIVRRKRC